MNLGKGYWEGEMFSLMRRLKDAQTGVSSVCKALARANC